MKTFNKEEYKKRCAEFLEWKKDYAHEFDEHGYCQTVDGYITPFINNNPQIVEYNSSIYIHSIDELKFDWDWNWIMQVIENIESIKYKYNGYAYLSIVGKNIWFYIYQNYNTTCPAHISGIQNNLTRQEAVVQAIWEFLNYYYENIQDTK